MPCSSVEPRLGFERLGWSSGFATATDYKPNERRFPVPPTQAKYCLLRTFMWQIGERNQGSSPRGGPATSSLVCRRLSHNRESGVWCKRLTCASEGVAGASLWTNCGRWSLSLSATAPSWAPCTSLGPRQALAQLFNLAHLALPCVLCPFFRAAHLSVVEFILAEPPFLNVHPWPSPRSLAAPCAASSLLAILPPRALQIRLPVPQNNTRSSGEMTTSRSTARPLTPSRARVTSL